MPRAFVLARQPDPTGAPLRNREPGTAPASWTTLVDEDLHIVEGSALDFNARSTTAVPAGSRGRVRAISGTPTKLEEADNPGVVVTFNEATWTASPIIPLTDKASITAGVQFLRRAGFNCLRLHGPENWICHGTVGALQFPADRLDLFRWLLSECKRLGIYYVINPASYRLYEDCNGGNRFDYTEANSGKPRMFTEQSMRDNFAAGFTALYLTTNPYTGTAPALDPACAQVEWYNESGITFCASVAFPSRWITRTPGATVAAQTWHEWIADPTKAHGYANLAAINASWGTAYASIAAIPAPGAYVEGSSYPQTQFAIDGLLFGLYLEDDMNTWYAARAAEWGLQCLRSTHHLYPSVVVARGAGKQSENTVSNTHGYTVIISSGNISPGSTFSGGKQNNPIWSIDNHNWLFAHPFVSSGKPRWYGEYGWPVWHRYRAHFAMQAAMAVMHDAAALTCYSQGNFFSTRYYDDRSAVGDRVRQVYPYHNNTDPTYDFTRALVALLWTGGASAHGTSLSMTLNDRFIGVSPRSTSRIGRGLSYLFQPLYFLTGFVKASLDYTSDTTSDSLAVLNAKSLKEHLDDMVTLGSITTGNATYVDVTANQGAISAVDITTDPANPRFTTAAHTLVTGDVVFLPSLTGSGANWPGTNNRWAPYVVTVLSGTQWSIPLNTASWTGTFSAGTWCSGVNVFESANGQFGFSRRAANCWINTGKVSYLSHIASTLPRALGSVTVTALDDHCSTFAASLDGQAINASSRLLLGLAGDAQNTGMTFTDGTRKVINTSGDYPIEATDATAQLSLALTRPTEWKLYRLQRNGTRTSAETPVSVDATTGRLIVKLRTGTTQPSVLWELVRG